MNDYSRADSGGSSETHDGSRHSSVTLNDSRQASPLDIGPCDAGRVKKRGRKGHTKSRAGCFNCKRARIKCKENRPACDYCAHRGLSCEWPDLQINQIGAVIQKPTVPVYSIPPNLQPSEPVFTAQDFRLFNHFVQNAYPHHPIGNDSVWTHEIPSIASNHDFLLHAMLALAASDIASHTDETNLTITAINHRVKSIEAFNRAVSMGVQSFEQGNAMIGACFALLFQSTLINDGLAEYMTFIRGVIAIAIQMGQKKMKFLFVKMFGDDQLEAIDPALKATPLLEPTVVAAACRSLENIGPLCTTPVEFAMYGHLLSMARCLITSSREGTSPYLSIASCFLNLIIPSREAYVALRKFYEQFIMMPQSDFRYFIDPNNKACHLLQAHFVAMQLITTPITKHEWGDRISRVKKEPVGRKTGRWLCTLHQTIPEDMREYYNWTLWVEDAVYNQSLGAKLLNANTTDWCSESS